MSSNTRCTEMKHCEENLTDISWLNKKKTKHPNDYYIYCSTQSLCQIVPFSNHTYKTEDSTCIIMQITLNRPYTTEILSQTLAATLK